MAVRQQLRLHHDVKCNRCDYNHSKHNERDVYAIPHCPDPQQNTGSILTSAFFESMQAYSSGDQFWVDHHEPHSDKNHRADNDQNASPT